MVIAGAWTNWYCWTHDCWHDGWHCGTHWRTAGAWNNFLLMLVAFSTDLAGLATNRTGLHDNDLLLLLATWLLATILACWDALDVRSASLLQFEDSISGYYENINLALRLASLNANCLLLDALWCALRLAGWSALILLLLNDDHLQVQDFFKSLWVLTGWDCCPQVCWQLGIQDWTHWELPLQEDWQDGWHAERQIFWVWMHCWEHEGWQTDGQDGWASWTTTTGCCCWTQDDSQLGRQAWTHWALELQEDWQDGWQAAAQIVCCWTHCGVHCGMHEEAQVFWEEDGCTTTIWACCCSTHCEEHIGWQAGAQAWREILIELPKLIC